MKGRDIKVIFDTNIWISFLIGKRLSSIKDLISNGSLTIVTTDKLLDEIKEVTSRPKLKKYFPKSSVDELIEFLQVIGQNISIKSKHKASPDPKDNFLLDLIDYSKADYLIMGDKELLKLNPFLTAEITTPASFEKLFKQ